MTDLSRRHALGAGFAAIAGIAASITPATAQSFDDSARRRFAGKAVVITGATSGIGRAAAEAFAREGASIAFCGRREVLGREAEAGLRSLGARDAFYVRADVRNPDQLRRFIDGAAEHFGGLDIALNNAGANWFKPLHETSLDEWEEMTQTNTRGVFLAMKYKVPHMIRRGGGKIVVTASQRHSVTASQRHSVTASQRRCMSMPPARAARPMPVPNAPSSASSRPPPWIMVSRTSV
ncbi:SDR family NAD(P)-dependent oxidoreductase [Azomonas macrocytogenes]|uniref:NAD(P)-dependent dehydrogenase (Short-subunit alcohol dehydrogenase family) n=1 Tax=Azomonas macrocytogenes TaxID=69962 RepID=A0A839T5M1_AZOMA|nr:SDR family NAD(P)-dependent oxidoreductase [Azomonas macrocytogenes]MBB3104388.1 NAD(P)-dependent dehydrogenase (short-subunit alcohol dehydrogenase family) [Azomonas macrocytogenes]